MQDKRALEMLERVLVKHRAFGNSDYIHEQLQFCYKRRLNKISARLPVAGQLLETLSRAKDHTRYRVIGDTVVRCTIQQTLRQLETGTQYGLPLDQCEEVFQATIRHLEENRSGGPLESGLRQVSRLGPDSYHGWVWSEEHSDDVFGRSFRFVIQENYGETLCTPTADELAILTKGARLLSELLPLLSRSAFSHAHLIAIFPSVGNWKSKASSSQYRVSGTIFLNRQALQNPWWVAEHLFHESLHQKLYDFRHGHSLLERDSVLTPESAEEDARTICSLWNMPDVNRSNYWDVHRAVAAFHVYVHLALLARLAEHRAPELEKVYGSQGGSLKMIESRRALGRAHYLGEQIKRLCWQELGLAGKRFINWLCAVLDALDPTPPPQGSYIHLLLDRYQTEAKRVESFLRKIDPHTVKNEASESSDLPQELINIIKDEVKSTRCVLSAVSTMADLNRFNNALAQYSNEELGTNFPQIRELISKTLMNLSPDGYRLKGSSFGSPTPDEMVKETVERSSQRLGTILPA